MARFSGTQIDVPRTPKLAEAAGRSITLRGPGDLEFSLAWRMGLWSRLGQPVSTCSVGPSLIEFAPQAGVEYDVRPAL